MERVRVRESVQVCTPVDIEHVLCLLRGSVEGVHVEHLHALMLWVYRGANVLVCYEQVCECVFCVCVW